MFVHDANTNRLSLKPDVLEPWIRPSHPRIAADDPNSWLYCTECRERWFRKKGERPQSHVPFRDKASQNWLKPTYRRGKRKEEADAPEHAPTCESSEIPSPTQSGRGDDVDRARLRARHEDDVRLRLLGGEHADRRQDGRGLDARDDGVRRLVEGGDGTG